MTSRPTFLRRRSRLWIVLGLALSLAITACGGGTKERLPVPTEWADVVAAARTEGEVQLYMSISQEIIDRLTTAFAEKYPEINVDVYRPGSGASAALQERMQNDRDAGNWIADSVTLTSPLWLRDAIADGIVATDVALPSAEKWDPAYWKDGVAVLMPTVLCVIYNTDLVSPEEVPRSWEDMADPRWRDRMAVFLPRPDTDSHTNLYQLYLENYGESFITRIKDLNPRVWDSATTLAESVAGGESAVGATFTHKAEDLIDSGAPVDYVVLDPAPTFFNSIFVAADAPHPNAARVFLDFAMSEEGQLAVAGDRKANSVLDLPGTLEMPESIYVPDIQKAAANYEPILNLLGRAR
ncbi:ABC transporter substrate-binding protein [Pseudonocardia zijingensis]|jgi:iron(III) transport system substrate-binding protein|uniref:Iron(III) transport system substrate-binding protein n=1 Tax=Pseudonocardia zijingensis TaxID=153376 RepID=A0ABP4AI85_9PSEU